MRISLVIFVLVAAVGFALAGGVDDVINALHAMQRGDYGEAIQLATSALASGDLAGNKDKLSITYYIRGKSYLGQSANEHHIAGLNEIAIVDLNEAIRLKPDFALAFEARGLANWGLRLFDQAIVDFQEALLLDPQDVKAKEDLQHLNEYLNAHRAKGLER